VGLRAHPPGQIAPAHAASPIKLLLELPMSEPCQRRRALLLVNQKSRQGQDAAGAAADALGRAGIELLREECSSADELKATIRRLASSVDMVVLGGGDGTMSSAAPALLDTALPLGILPLGTANDLARTLGIPLDLDEAVQVIINGQLRRIDLGEVNGHPFFNVASIGLSVQVARELSSDLKKRWGRLGYALATGRALWRMRPFSAEIRHGGVSHEVRTIQIAVGNGHYYGGGMAVEEDAEIDDGLLRLYSLEFESLWKLALIYPAFRSGTHGMWREVRTAAFKEAEVRTRRPRPVNADGELITQTPARFRLLKDAISVFTPTAGA
jgi:YegS/Rv2252/BmrU family lipid kinase